MSSPTPSTGRTADPAPLGSARPATEPPPAPPTARLPDYAERVLDLVEAIPPGCALSYGDIAAQLGAGGPRQVGQVMARYGAAVCWWRVVRADGWAPQGHERRALEHYRAEGTPMRAPGVPRLDMRRARWNGGA